MTHELDAQVVAVVSLICEDVLPAYGVSTEVGRADIELPSAVRAALSADLSAAKSEPVAVKALEWWKSDTGDWCADTMIGRYQVQATTRQASTSYYRLFVPRGKIQEHPDLCSSEDEAKATAQSHFDNAIRSALASEPANG